MHGLIQYMQKPPVCYVCMCVCVCVCVCVYVTYVCMCVHHHVFQQFITHIMYTITAQMNIHIIIYIYLCMNAHAHTCTPAHNCTVMTDYTMHMHVHGLVLVY